MEKLTLLPDARDTIKHSKNQIEAFHLLLNYILEKSHNSEFVNGIKYIEARIKADLYKFENKQLLKCMNFICFLNKFSE